MKDASYALLERTILRHCTPTLAGIKPANMFVLRHCFCTSSADNRRMSPLTRLRKTLSQKGVYLQFLAQRKTGILVLVYRPALMSAAIKRPLAQSYLEKRGYKTDDLSDCIEHLHRRICGTDIDSLLHGCCCFPHEVGFFLGYPCTDVLSFIENEGRGSLCVGCWKVYSHEADAKECFCRYRECTEDFLRQFDDGASIADLVLSAA